MTLLTPGQTVGLPCMVQPGAFSNEYLVTIETEEGILSGFAHQEDVRRDATDPSKGTVRGTVIELKDDMVKVRICGSFFTIAAGTTLFSTDWASIHFQIDRSVSA